ncbi:hypothetical protein ACCS93_33500 [Rhizobium ruizarguesonis]
MAKTGKQTVASHKRVRARIREADHRFQARATQSGAAKIASRLNRSDKRKRYEMDLELLDKAGTAYRGEVGYDPIGNKRLIVETEGELTRERGYFTKTRKVQKRDSDGKAYIGRFEKESRRRKSRYDFDETGKLTAKSVRDKDGRFEEKWERDENDVLIRTKYSTSRFRDVGDGPAVYEELHGPFERNGKKYRTLVRQVGSTKSVFERDQDGNLQQISHETPNFSKFTTKSKDEKTSRTDIKHRGKFSKSYLSRLDADGREISREITSIRRLWNKRSAKYDDKTGRMTGAKHTFGKLYKSETQFLGETQKYTTRKIFGLRLLPRKLKALTPEELNAAAIRTADVSEHEKAWKDATFVHQPPTPGTTKRLGSGATRLVEDKESFLKSREASGPSKTASVSHGTNPEAAALLAAWKSVSDKEAEKTKPLSRQSSIRSASESSVIMGGDEDLLNFGRPQTRSRSTLIDSDPEDEEEAFLKSREASGPSKTAGASVSHATTPEAEALLAAWKPVDATSALINSDPKDDLWSPANEFPDPAGGADASKSNTSGKDAAARRGFDRDDRARASRGDW